MKKIKIECNNINCKHHWEIDVIKERIIRNRLIGLETCPKCGRYDSPYIIE